MKNDINKICKKRMTKKYCNNIILSKQKSFNLDILNDILKIINIDPFITRNEIKIKMRELQIIICNSCQRRLIIIY
jgi:hypothetical protein